MAGAAAENAIEVVEPPAVRPTVKRSGGALLPVRCQVPFADRRGAVAVVAQDPRQRRTVPGQDGRVARKAIRELTDRAEADRVAVPAGQQGRPRRRAHRGDMEPVVAQTFLGEAGVVRRRDGTAERRRVAKTGVIDQHQQHVWRPLGRPNRGDRRPVRLRSVQRPVDPPLEGRTTDRQSRAVRRFRHPGPVHRDFPGSRDESRGSGSPDPQ